MKNVLILGSGRSGTSLTAGLFRNSGAYFGDHPVAATESNPRGYYEDHLINRLNDRLIWQILDWPRFNRLRTRVDPPFHNDYRCFWLAAPWWLRHVTASDDNVMQIKHFAARQPFCYKDPRFSVTLEMWRPYLPADICCIVLFRDPRRTVTSMLHDAELYDPPLQVPRRWAYLSWYRTYRRLLRRFSRRGDWLFIHYDQVLDGRAAPALESFAQTKLDTSEIDPSLSRSKPDDTDGQPEVKRCQRLYRKLVARSNRDLRRLGQ